MTLSSENGIGCRTSLLGASGLATMALLQACTGGSATGAATANTQSMAVSAPAAADTQSVGAGARATIQAVTIPVSAPGVPASSFTNFEVAQVHPVDLTPDGTKLLVVNTALGALEVFDVTGASPALISVIKVGVEPITVRAASNTQAWVVNEISDSVSIVDIKNDALIATLQTDDEPADVVFAGNPRRAYVSVAQAKELMVFDPIAPVAALARLPILGQQPRALAVSPDGSKIYLGIFESGNGTTALTGGKNDRPVEVDIARSTSNPYGGVSPFPDTANGSKYTNLYGAGSANPPPPVSVIVRRSASADGGLPQWLDANGKNWSAFINGSLAQLGSQADRAPGWDLIDRDVAIIDTATQNVTYQGGPLNIVMALAVNPATGAVTTIGTDATNQIRYEPVVDGTFLKVMFGSFVPGQATTAAADLNPALAAMNYSASSIPAAQRQNSIGDPRGIAWNAAGTKAYVTGMGSDNVIVVNGAGARVGAANPAAIPVGQGPTGVVLQESQGRAFVLNRFDATISVISLSTETETARIALSYDPTPAVIRAGRPMLYDTHLNSGLGQISCASCHVDAKTDRLDWDLGNPALAMSSSIDNSTGTPRTVPQHPMKGPMLTMTLIDRMQSPFLHWRGDRLNLSAFAGAFQTLQGGDAPATGAQIANMQAFLATTRTPPNPFRLTLTNAYPTELAVPGPRGYPYRTGNAVAGAQEFEANCRSCHVGQTGRGANFVNDALTGGLDFGVGQSRNPPTWQNFYRRDGFWFGDATASTAGFGYGQDGTFDSTHNATRSDNLMAFMYSFNGSFPYTPAGLNATNVANDSHAALGRQVTLSGSAIADPQLAQLQALADTNAVDLVASGCVNNENRGFVYVGNSQYAADRGDVFTLAQMKAIAAAGSPLTFTAVRRGTGYRIGIDANMDGNLDGVAGATGTRVCTGGTVRSLLVNGSFENNAVPSGGWQNVTSLPGWTGSNGNVQVWNGLFGYPAVDGGSWMQVGGGSTLDTVSQPVTTTAGDSLVLKFWYSARPAQPASVNAFNVVWNGTVIDTLAPNGAALNSPAWRQATYIVRATGKDTLSFAQAAGSTPGMGALIDAASLVDMGTGGTTLFTPAANLAFGRPATAASNGSGTVASNAVDGNVDGSWFNGSVSITNGNAQDWWEVDLGATSTIQTVNLFNRTDCCATRLANFYVLVSAGSMDGQSLAQLLANTAVTKRYVATTGYVFGNSPQLFTVGMDGAQGRFVRVQLAGTNQLQLAEVQVMGWPPGAK